jgi:REP element-mobilizing transposase RayT
MSDPIDHWTPPIAYHLTFTTYGTWLHGDARGSVNRKATSQRDQFIAPDPVRNELMRERLIHPTVLLDARARRIVREAIEDYCRFKAWRLMALNVRTNHVHAVVGADESPSKMLNAIKARATRMLRAGGAFEAGRPVWTERGNKGRLLTPEAVTGAIGYVLSGQGTSLPEE